jgi:hypothetical protein
MDLGLITEKLKDEYDGCLIEIYLFAKIDGNIGTYTIDKTLFNNIFAKLKDKYKYTTMKHNVYVYRDTELIIDSEENITVIGKSQMDAIMEKNSLIIISKEILLKTENIPMINQYHDERSEEIYKFIIGNIAVNLIKSNTHNIIISFVFNKEKGKQILSELATINKFL